MGIMVFYNAIKCDEYFILKILYITNCFIASEKSPLWTAIKIVIFLIQQFIFIETSIKFHILHKTFSLFHEYVCFHEHLYTNYKCKCFRKRILCKRHPIKKSCFFRRTWHAISIAWMFIIISVTNMSSTI